MTEPRTAKILVVSPIVPNPPNRGMQVVLTSLLDSLSEQFDITLLARVTSAREIDDAQELSNRGVRVALVMSPERKSFWHKIFYRVVYYATSVIRRRSLKQLYECPRALVREARELSEKPFDLVIICSWQLFEPMAFFQKPKTVLLTQGMDWTANRKMSLLERNLMKKIQSVRKWLLEQPEELRAYRSASHIWTLTDQDRSVVEVVCRHDSDVEVMPLGLDIEFFTPSGMQRNQGEILFLGHLDEPPNLDALDFLARKIYPRIDDLSEWSITIVGGNLPGDLEYFGLLPEVEVVGRVPDVRPYLHRAACLIVPLRFGDRLKVRVLEAMAAGLPVVSSSAGMGGLPFEPEKEFLKAETPEEFAVQITRLLGDRGLAESLSGHAVRRVSQLFARDVARERVHGLVERRLRGVTAAESPRDT